MTDNVQPPRNQRKKLDAFRKEFAKHLTQKPHAEVMHITPHMAEVMLEHNLVNGVRVNRKMREERVLALSQDMADGKFDLTGESIIFTSDGVLNDGQHRLAACVKSGIAMDCLVMFGVKRETFSKVDIGAKRTAADIFGIKGEHHAAALASAISWIIKFETDRVSAKYLDTSAEHLWQHLDKNHPKLRDVVAENYTQSKMPGVSPSLLCALHYWIGRTAHAIKPADEFFYSLCSGNDIGSRSRKHPINRLRERIFQNAQDKLKGQSLAQATIAAYIVKSWNAWRKGAEVTQLVWRGASNPDEPFPRPR